MNRLIKIVFVSILLLGVFSVVTMYWIFKPEIPMDAQILPTKIIHQQKSPDKSIVAEVFEGKAIEGLNPLGSDIRFYLVLNYNNTRHLVLRDLSEGFGTYEGGVFGVKWIDNNRIYIERAVGDSRADLIYNLSMRTWVDVKK